MKRRRMMRVGSALALVFALSLPVVALAAQAISATHGSLPSGWTRREQGAGGDRLYDLTLERKMENDSGQQIEHVWVSVWQTTDPRLRYTDIERFLDAWDMKRSHDSARSAPGLGEEYSSSDFGDVEYFVGMSSGETEIYGHKAYFTEGTDETRMGGADSAPQIVSWGRIHYIDTGDSAVYVSVGAYGRFEAAGEIDALRAEAQSVFKTVDIDWGGGTAGTTGGGLPWAATVGSVAAAAAALAGSMASKKGKRTKLDRNEHVGYVLELPAMRLGVSSAKPVGFTVRAWRVLASGAVEPADDATITLRTTHQGVSVAPPAGRQQLQASVQQNSDLPLGAWLVVEAQGAKGGTSARIALVPEDRTTLELRLEPEGHSLRPNGKDVARVTATLKAAPALAADPGFDAEGARRSITFAHPPSTQWLEVGQEVDVPGGKAVGVSASPPDPDHPGTPPESVRVVASAQIGGRLIQAFLDVPLERPPVIDARPDIVEFAAEAKQQADVLVWIEHAGGIEWRFSTRWREGDRPLAQVALHDETPSSVVAALTEDAAKLPDTGLPEEAATLVVTAIGEGWDPLERYVKVIVTREGLFIDPIGRSEDGSYHVIADGKGKPIDIDFRVFVRQEDGTVRNDVKLASALEFTPADEPGSRSRNAAEVAGVAFSFAGTRPSNEPSATWRCGVANPIPGDVPVLMVRYTVAVPGQPDEEKYAKPLVIGMRPSQDAPGGPDWRRELDRTKHVILEFVPLAYQGKLMDILDRRARSLGADGLAAMRRQVWSIAQDLTLGEGGQGYLEEGKWAGRIETVLDYAQWAGDIAFHAATAHFVGPYYALGAAQLKQLVVSAIVAYEEGLTPEDWLWQNVGAIPGILEGQVIDVDKFSKLTGGSKAKAWALFIAYHFFKNYLYAGKSFTDSLIEAGRAARDEAIAAWIGAELRKAPAGPKVDVQKPKPAAGPPAGEPGAAKPGVKPPAKTTKPAAPAKPPVKKPVHQPTAVQKKPAEAVKASLKTGPDGKPVADEGVVLEIMRDPTAMRKLKNASPEVKQAFNAARKQIYERHSSRLIDDLKRDHPELAGKDLQVVEVRTPGKQAGPDDINTDHDFRVVEVRKGPDGKPELIEVDSRKWVDSSNRIFAEETGAPKDADPAQWAKDHGETGTDKYHTEASADYSDQKLAVERGPDGKMRAVVHQVPSTITKMKNGENVTLKDPEGFARMWEGKVHEAQEAGHPAEAYAQAGKAAECMDVVQKAYERQKLQVPGAKADPDFQRALDAVRKAGADSTNPKAVAEADRVLRECHYDGLQGFMNQMGARFEGFKWAK